MKTRQKHIANSLHKAFCGKHAKREKGFVLVLTLMMISLLSVLAITSFELVISTMRITNNHKNYLKALYTADAGVEHALCVLSNPVVSWSGLNWTNPSTLSTLNLNNTSLISSYRWDPFDSVNKKWTATKTDLGDTYTVTLTMNMTIILWLLSLLELYHPLQKLL
jgi:Tfp pilus assembly protein PilX